MVELYASFDSSSRRLSPPYAALQSCLISWAHYSLFFQDRKPMLHKSVTAFSFVDDTFMPPPILNGLPVQLQILARPPLGNALGYRFVDISKDLLADRLRY
jgi:hypothetical protein